MKRLRTIWLAPAISALTLLALAGTAVAQSGGPPPGAHPHETRAGIAVVDQVLGAVESGASLVDHLQFVDVDCGPGLGGIECPEVVDEGTSIPAVFSGACEGVGIAEDDADGLDQAFGAGANWSEYFLYGVTGGSPGFPESRYHLYLVKGSGPAEDAQVGDYVTLTLGESGILSRSACNPLGETFERQADVVFAPAEAGPAPPGTGSAGLATGDPGSSSFLPLTAVGVAIVAMVIATGAWQMRRTRA